MAEIQRTEGVWDGISAALALSPYPIPSEMPAPSAMIFFSAPPISVPVTSPDV